jgi:DNA-binding transcriptional regulator YhcF (GntR family)
VGGLHTGQLHSGDRLPSIRELAFQMRKNPRTIKAAYAALGRERLVEVRGRSGVFVAPQEVLAGEVPAEMARWLSSVVTEGWQRRVAVPDLPKVLQRATALRVRCALVEDVQDAIVALRYELEVDWGFEVRVVPPHAIATVGDVDVFVATSFRAPAAHGAAEAAGTPLIVLTSHATLQQAIRQRLRERRLTVVAVDPRFGERIRVAYADDVDRKNCRVVLASDVEAVARLDPDEPVLLTRAARQRLGPIDLRMIYPHSPTLSLETARALAAALIRKNLTPTQGPAGH